MTKQPGPLMDVTNLPQQRLYSVPEIPDHLFGTKVEIAEAGDPGVPKKIPRGARSRPQARPNLTRQLDKERPFCSS